MLGGGTFEKQNKILPGTYINFVSSSHASAELSERGYVTMPFVMKWGADGITTITRDDFEKNSLVITGYSYGAEENKPIREIFKHSHTIYAYKLNGDGTKASNDYATAKCKGSRGNDIKLVISADVDDTSKFDVLTYIDTDKVDSQVVSDYSELKENDYIKFDKGATLAETSGMPLTGGTDSTATTTDYQNYLNAIESYSYNAMGCPSSDTSIKALFVAFTKRMRDNRGVKFQTILYNQKADYEGCINLKNKAEENDTALVYWLTGAEGGCKVNESCSNMEYDGEYTVVAEYTQTELENAMTDGELVFHQVGSDIRILEDINSLTTTTDTKGDDFKYNQTMRVLDQIANDVATLFNTKYYGKIPNDKDGRVSLWNSINDIYKELVQLRAIENHDDNNLTVEQGDTKKSVVATSVVTPINCMSQLYMTVKVV